MDELFRIKPGAEAEEQQRIMMRVHENAALMERQRKMAYPELFVGEVPRFASRTKSEGDEVCCRKYIQHFLLYFIF